MWGLIAGIYSEIYLIDARFNGIVFKSDRLGNLKAEVVKWWTSLNDVNNKILKLVNVKMTNNPVLMDLKLFRRENKFCLMSSKQKVLDHLFPKFSNYSTRLYTSSFFSLSNFIQRNVHKLEEQNPVFDWKSSLGFALKIQGGGRDVGEISTNRVQQWPLVDFLALARNLFWPGNRERSHLENKVLS